MKTYAVYYSSDAVDDLRNIYTYIFNELAAPETAKAQIDRIRKGIRSLNMFPERYKAVKWEPWHSIGMRQFSIDNFVVFYIVNDTSVNVVRIFYYKRDIRNVIVSSDN